MDFFRSIQDNRQWIFDGIGVVVVVAIGKFLYFRLGKKDKPASVHQTGQTGTGHVIQVNAPVSGNLTVGDATTNHPVASTPVPKSSTITAKQIQNDIQLAPPFQQGERARYYEGLPIDWNCRYMLSTKAEDDVVVITLDCWNDGILFACHCEVLLSEYPRLKILPAKTSIRIVGTLGKVSASEAVIKDAKLFF